MLELFNLFEYEIHLLNSFILETAHILHDNVTVTYSYIVWNTFKYNLQPSAFGCRLYLNVSFCCLIYANVI